MIHKKDMVIYNLNFSFILCKINLKDYLAKYPRTFLTCVCVLCPVSVFCVLCSVFINCVLKYQFFQIKINIYMEI